MVLIDLKSSEMVDANRCLDLGNDQEDCQIGYAISGRIADVKEWSRIETWSCPSMS